jgi:hypothetical protein
MKPIITMILIEVSVFCTRAMNLTPNRFSTVNRRIMAAAAICAPPNCRPNAADPK